MLAAFASFLIGGALVGYVVYYNLSQDDTQVLAASNAPPALPDAPVVEGEPSDTPSAQITTSPSPLAEAVAALEGENAEVAA